MSRAHSGAVLEQACVEPGHWRIEGYDAYRCRDGSETYWEIFRFGRRVTTAVTLSDARAWIGSQVFS